MGIVEVPEVEYVHRVVEVPKVQVQEVVRHVPRIQMQEAIRHVPKIEKRVVEKFVEVPEVQYVEKIVEVPQVRVREVIKEVPKKVQVPRNGATPSFVPQVQPAQQLQGMTQRFQQQLRPLVPQPHPGVFDI